MNRILAALLIVALARIWTAEDTHRALDGAPYVVECIVAKETGDTYDPYSVGRAGELGVVQLHPQGELSSFMYGDWTPLPSEYRDPFNPYQSVAFLEQYGRSHGGNFQPWISTWRLCA